MARTNPAWLLGLVGVSACQLLVGIEGREGGLGAGGAAGAAGAPSTGSCDDSPVASLVSWWHFDGPGPASVFAKVKGKSADALFRHHATNSSGTVGTALGVQGIGASFGNGAFYTIDDAPPLIEGAQLTLDMWVAPTSPGPLFANASQNAVDGVLLEITAERTARFVVGDVEVSTTSILSGAVSTHLAATYDGDRGIIALYIDGKPESSAAAPLGPLPSSGLAPRLGADHATPPRHYAGALDELRVWSTALSARQVLAQRTGESCAVVDALRWDFQSAPSSSPPNYSVALPGYQAPGFMGFVSHTLSGANTGGNPWLTSYLFPTNSGPYVNIQTTRRFRADQFWYWSQSNPSTGSFSVAVEQAPDGITQPDGEGFVVVGTYEETMGPGAARSYDLGLFEPGTHLWRIRATSAPAEQTCWIGLGQVSLIGTIQ